MSDFSNISGLDGMSDIFKKPKFEGDGGAFDAVFAQIKDELSDNSITTSLQAELTKSIKAGLSTISSRLNIPISTLSHRLSTLPPEQAQALSDPSIGATDKDFMQAILSLVSDLE